MVMSLLRKGNSRCFLISCMVVILYSVVFIYMHPHLIIKNGGVYTKQDICIEQHPSEAGKKVLVMYNSDHDSEKQELFKDHHSENSRYPGWPVFHRKGPIPEHHIIRDHPAYFMVTTCEGNLHHYIDDSLIGLQGLLEATSRLGEWNQVFTTICQSEPEDVQLCHSLSRYVDLALNLRIIPDTYGCIDEFPKTNVCYPYAGFGFKATGKKAFYKYQISQFGLTEASCPGTGILLVDRRYRRVTNIQQLKEATEALGLPNTHVEIVDFEGLSVKEQVKKAYCSHIMVGVQGAGLQWVYFLPDHSAVLEIGWKRWESKYVGRGKTVGVKGKFIDCKDNVTVNWDEYQKYNPAVNLTEQAKRNILANNKLIQSQNAYKFADTYIDVNVYLGKLTELIKELEKDGVKF